SFVRLVKEKFRQRMIRRMHMAKFLFVYRNGNNPYGQMTPEEIQQHHQKWFAWITEGMQKGWMLDPGDGLTRDEGRVVKAKVVSDGPFMETKELVGGFSIVQADSIDAAAQLAQGCPGLAIAATV